MSVPLPFITRGKASLYHGDCRTVAPSLGLFDAVVTDPPYELGFMGKSWDRSGVAFQPETWLRIKEACKPGAMLLAFGGTRTFHRLTCAIEDAGWEIRDCLMWLYGQGWPKSLDISKQLDKEAGAERDVIHQGEPVKRMIPGADQEKNGSWIKDNCREYVPSITAPATDAARIWSGWGTSLKPSWEPVILAMKPLDGTFTQNAKAHGVAGLNIDGCRIPVNPDVDDPRLGGNGTWGTSNAAKNVYEGGYAGERVGSSALGRFPANLILDEEAGELLDLQAGPQKSGGTPARRISAKTKNAFGDFNGQENPDGIGSSSGNVSRFFYCAKTSRRERGATNKHPTVKPQALMRYLCRLVKTPAGGRILDPFAGSGSTLIAAHAEGIESVGVEELDEHCRMAADRMREMIDLGGLNFTEVL